MAQEGDSSPEEEHDIRSLVTRIAKREGELRPVPVGYIVACEYLDDSGDRKWALRYDPDQGYGTHLGLAKLIELDADRVARETLGIDE